MSASRYPTLYQVNTRVWLNELGRQLGRTATLDDIPDANLDQLVDAGFRWIWLLSVWQTGLAGQQISRTNPEWRHEFEKTLPDLQEEDIVGSGFAITAYKVDPSMGGDAALARLRTRLADRGLQLMLDFVPNHMALDHPWINDHPDYFIQGTDLDLARAPKNYTWVRRPQGDLLLAYGRDPYFAGWPDTLQLNYGNPDLQEAMRGELKKIATQCDGVRCDMAMLVLPDIFERTWGVKAQPFWPETINQVRAQVPDFCFMAEVYWDLEWTLQQQGFNYTYDKRLYDRLVHGPAQPVRDHLRAAPDFQDRSARFLENHDEPRAAAVFPIDQHKAAATITYLSPGLRFFHQGQLEGRVKKISPHLVRAPQESADPEISEFYHQLLAALRLPIVHEGQWQLLDCTPGWEGNGSCNNFIVTSWSKDHEHLVVAVNYSADRSQCHVRLPFQEVASKKWRLEDQLSHERYTWNGQDLVSRGLYLEMAGWQAAAYLLVEDI